MDPTTTFCPKWACSARGQTGQIGAQDVMNAHTLPQVKMPNRDNFMVVYPTKPK